MGRRTRGSVRIERMPRLSIGQETWVNVLDSDVQRLAASHPEVEVLGWAHTHPGYGPLFSRGDVAVCRRFGPGALNLVLDPLTLELGLAWAEHTFAVVSLADLGFDRQQRHTSRHDGVSVACPPTSRSPKPSR